MEEKSVRLFRVVGLVILAGLVGSAILAFGHAGGVGRGEGFSVKEYEDFHQVLHELQHEALPKRDFARIRAKADELVGLGNAIVKLGVPRGTTETKVEEFKKELKKFSDALTKYSADAKDGTDDKLEESYGAVHESFETLAGMLPRKS